MSGFNQQAVNDNGGVAWAKQVAQTMDPGAIDSQIQGYQSAISSLANVQSTLQNVKNNLASSWSGDAADQAQQSFQTSLNHVQLTQETISQAVIPALQGAKAAQQQYVSTVSSVPDEQPVPQNSVIDDVGSWFGAETPAQKAQNHNTAVRTQTAEALNTLSDSYESSASKLNAVGGSQETLHSTSDAGAYSLGSVSSSSGDGAASSYSSRVNGGGATGTAGYSPSSPNGTVNPGSNPSTTLAGTSPTQTTNP
ncbi:WXG100 family type VII secretion target, partial [Actinospica sp.]|uniref:WXG100 family type VII secretion target n=1 Tax=Actinospica sp. TaxID=1872142 RepID=UPI002C3B4ABC